MDENTFRKFLYDHISIIKPKYSIVAYFILLILSFILTFIIPFMYFTLKAPMPMYDNAISTMNLFTLANFIQIFIFSLIVLIFFRNDLSFKISNSMMKIQNNDSNIDENKNLLNESVKTFYRYKVIMLFILFIPFWGSLITAFIHVTGPLVLSNQIYFVNNIPLVLYLIYELLTFPSTEKTINYFIKKFN